MQAAKAQTSLHKCAVWPQPGLLAHTLYMDIDEEAYQRELSGRVLDLRPRGHRFEPHRRHCVVSLSKNINPSLVLVQPRKTCPFITERLLMGNKESNQTNKQILDMQQH